MFGVEKAIVIVLGGISDHAIDGLGRKTPLQVARTPNLEHLAMLGATGVFHPTVIGEAVSPWLSMYLLLGNPRELYPGLAAFEAIGRGIKLSKKKYYAILEPCVVENGRLVEKRPFEDDSEIESFLGFLKKHFKNVKTLGKGRFLLESDNFLESYHPWNIGVPVDEKKLSDINYLPSAWEGNNHRVDRGLSPINALFVYGVGRLTDFSSSSFDFSGFKFYTDSYFFKGLLEWMGLGCEFFEDSSLIGNLQKFLFSATNCKDCGVYFFYSDYIHRNDFQYKAWKKVEFIEELDGVFSYVVDSVVKDNILFVLTSDSTTLSDGYKPYSGLPVPVLMVGPLVRRGRTARFDEASSVNGSLGIIRGKELMLILRNYLGIIEVEGF
ncbi:MAG: hypothetical protein ACPLSJ_00750 [Thermosulfidibacteraceae bacterium]|jgi:2,3-bisphosphoglycerate-independent phosphoglycerate mutase